MTDMVGDWIYLLGFLLGYCIEMAYRRSRHRRMSRKAGRASRKGGLKRGRRATRKGGLKRGGLSRRVKRGGGMRVSGGGVLVGGGQGPTDCHWCTIGGERELCCPGPAKA